MANPVLKEKNFREAAPVVQVTGQPAAPPRVMTLDGTIQKTALLFVILLATGFVGWQSVGQTEPATFPVMIIPASLGALVFALIAIFKPASSRIFAPLYAACEGYVVGAISAAYNLEWNGIVYQAVMGTMAVFLVMLVLFRSGKLRATPRFTKMVIGLTAGIFLTYMVTWLINLFGGHVPFIQDLGSPWGVVFSVFVIGVASLNLIIDFEFIDQMTRTRSAPTYMEWYAGLGLMITVVWLYLEMLRLLARLRSQ